MTFQPSMMQQHFFDWIVNRRGSAVLIAVAGSGKSTTIVQALPLIPRHHSVQVLAFNTTIAAEMRDKIDALSNELVAQGHAPLKASARTFHSIGFGALLKRFGCKADQVNTDGRKLRKLFREIAGEDDQRHYGSFVPKLVGLGKGEGVGALVANSDDEWWKLIRHHDLQLDSLDANEEKAIEWARRLLAASNAVAETKRWIDFDDQLYLPILWRLRMWQNMWVFVDEAQDTNPIRRAMAKAILLPGGRLVAVGDPNQAIYGFTGASHDAIDLIKSEFRAVALPLTVSYRCPKVAVDLVKEIVPHFSVHENAIVGEVLHKPIMDGIAMLGNKDAVLCRNTAPLVATAFQLLAQGRGCVVLGKDIGADLVDLIKKQEARGIANLLAKLDTYLETQVSAFMAKGEEEKADALTDRVECIKVVVENLPTKERTIPALCERIESLFSETMNESLLTLCTAHKAKGKEWKKVGILLPGLMPSKWARQEWQYQQELNLMYVAYTRFQETLIMLDDSNTDEEDE